MMHLPWGGFSSRVAGVADSRMLRRSIEADAYNGVTRPVAGKVVGDVGKTRGAARVDGRWACHISWRR